MKSKKTLEKLFFFPIIHIIIEYLEDSGRCICNSFGNDRFRFARTSKEVWEYMSKYGLLPTLYTMKKIPSNISHFFIRPYLCMKHHVDESIIKYIDNLFHSISQLLKKKEFPGCLENEYHPISGGELEFIRRLRRYDNKEFIHCSTCEDAEELKCIIKNQCINVFLNGNSCCTGKGFSIELHPD
jgi:hypothetical protein